MREAEDCPGGQPGPPRTHPALHDICVAAVVAVVAVVVVVAVVAVAGVVAEAVAVAESKILLEAAVANCCTVCCHHQKPVAAVDFAAAVSVAAGPADAAASAYSTAGSLVVAVVGCVSPGRWARASAGPRRSPVAGPDLGC